ncbi:hypothetical protein SAMN06265337_1018 [Hymenobacter gelipurpurascens]|uniref:Dolichyl-phosphate-mannose-protein mannosyltransferase n=1 Tax=Hymenobacter gelipurpurascens TaxID=89968 RepID=A0A212TDM7_9BACT|nr:hypothetical protein [Hymenobacter gelipurpurascens]SNC64129.1 hypothetical protein SAMN06265337_1018 [Hymenobacter gelipurpurascens]
MPSPNLRTTPLSSAFPLGFLALFFLLLSSGLGLLYSTVSVADLQAVRHAIYQRNEMPEFVLAVTSRSLTLLRFGLLGTVVISAAIVAYQIRHGRLFAELRQVGQQGKAAVGSVVQSVRSLSKLEWLIAGVLLLGILALRLYYFRVYPLGTDEIATYDYFISGGPVAITSFYPIPNNHILFSLSCWVVSWFTSHDVLVLRLPTLLISSIGTVVAYALLVRLANFRVATLAVGLFCLSPFTLYYSIAGRGYFLLIVLALGQFFVTLALLHTRRYQQLAWAAFVVLGVLGMYTIPTYIYPLFSLGLWIACTFIRRREGSQLLTLAGATVLIAGGTLLAYSPIISISGMRLLIANDYIAPQTPTEFWQSYALYLHQPARELFGHERFSVGGFLALLVAALVALPFMPRRWRWVAMPALALTLLPFLYMPLQLVYSPARVLLYAVFFFFVAVALAGDLLLQRLRVSNRLASIGIGLAVSLYGVYQVAHFRYTLWNAQRADQQLRQAYAWLRPQEPRQVFFEAPFHKLYFHHYALTTGYPLELFEASSAQKSPYDFVVRENNAPKPAPWLLTRAYHPVYSDDRVTIYGAGQAPVAQPNSAARVGK